MFFDDLDLFGSNTFVSPGSIGGKIKKYRELRGWTQKELGIRAGFSQNTADVRIAQYEKNKRLPKEKVLKDIAAALGIDETALFDADLLVQNRMYHALFDLEDFHGLHPVKIGDDYYLEFSGETTVHTRSIPKRYFYFFLQKWYEKRQEYMSGRDDSSEEKEKKRAQYALWRGGYPHNEAVEMTNKMHDQIRMERLQAEMDALNAKMRNDEELQRIDESLKDIMSDVRSACDPVRKESDLILRIKKAIEGGLDVRITSPEDSMNPDHEFMHLFSVKTEDILNDKDKQRLFAEIVCGIEDIQQCGMEISRKITSCKGELFVTYSHSASQYMYFKNLLKFWDDMIFIAERKDIWPDFHLNEYEENFKRSITGKQDVSFVAE